MRSTSKRDCPALPCPATAATPSNSSTCNLLAGNAVSHACLAAILSKARTHLRVVRSRKKGGRNRRRANVRLAVRPAHSHTHTHTHTHTERCNFLCGRPPMKVFSHSAAPVPGPSNTSMRQIPGPVSWECRNTACARKTKERRREHQKSGAEHVHHSFLLMHPRLVVGSGPFFLSSLPSLMSV